MFFTSVVCVGEACICFDTWTGTHDARCSADQAGCAADANGMACDGDAPWCIVANPGCNEEEDGEEWAYCSTGSSRTHASHASHWLIQGRLHVAHIHSGHSALTH